MHRREGEGGQGCGFSRESLRPERRQSEVATQGILWIFASYSNPSGRIRINPKWLCDAFLGVLS